MKKLILSGCLGLINFFTLEVYSEQLRLLPGCYQGILKSSISVYENATITMRIGKNKQGKYTVRESDSDLDLLNYTTNVKSVRYHIKQSKYHPIFVGYPPETGIGFSYFGVPRTSVKQRSAARLLYARTVREYDSEHILTDISKIKGYLTKMDSSICAQVFKNGYSFYPT